MSLIRLRLIAATKQTLSSKIYDRGKEMAEHARLAERLAIRIFFADSYIPWQRGTKENPMACCLSISQGSDLSGYTWGELNAIAHRLNRHP